MAIKRVGAILWHNSATNETQLWAVDGHRRVHRATVVDEQGNPALVGPPWSIVTIIGSSNILWHNSETNETQMWLMDRHRRTGRATVVGEDGQPVFIGPPFSIV